MEKINCAISAGKLNDLPDSGYLEIKIGNNSNVDFYVDDIRFYPEKSLMTTYYYDHQLVKPITFVDEKR